VVKGSWRPNLNILPTRSRPFFREFAAIRRIDNSNSPAGNPSVTLSKHQKNARLLCFRRAAFAVGG